MLLKISCLCFVSSVIAHLSDVVSTPSDRVGQYCILAESCFHDTIAICGKMGDQTRSFLDLCDLLEYGCDTSDMYVHIDDIKDCPAAKTTPPSLDPALFTDLTPGPK